MNKYKIVKNLVIVSILTALSVVLRMFAVGLAVNNRIIFHNIPLIIIGLCFGPYVGALSGFICDISSILYQPGWNPLFIITTILWGLIPGLLRNFFNYKKIGGLFSIEAITHILVSVANTIVMAVLMGWEIALGKINMSRSYDFIITLFDKDIVLFHIGEFIYLRIIFVVIIMLIKIPIDTLILKAIIKRNILPINSFSFYGVKNATKI